MAFDVGLLQVLRAFEGLSCSVLSNLHAVLKLFLLFLPILLQ